MSIYIKGMELPESCGSCDTQGLKNAIWHFGFGCDGDIDDFANCPPTRCPLIPVPPHGRLIDADELLTSKSVGTQIAGWGKMYHETCIEYAPTIIPADKEN